MFASILTRLAPRAGDIGEPLRHIEIEPIPTTEPIREPSPAVEPATPAVEPERSTSSVMEASGPRIRGSLSSQHSTLGTQL